MADIRFTQATGAYGAALKAAENILSKVSAAGVNPGGSSPVASAGNNPFLDMVGGALQSAAQSGYKSEEVATKALMGKADITDVVTAVSNAETALNTVVAVRDRVINAYQDIIKMPI
jgi:flagellar hook-basal body complex protein FliE